jgi:O-antigen/teichoic acid export membrane protein
MRDNVILFIGSIIAGVLGFVFHFYMGRILGPAGYSILGVILSIITLMGIGLNTLQTGITKLVSNLNSKKEYSKINYLISRFINKLTKYGIILLIIFVLITPLLAKFLNITVTPLLIISPCVIFLMLLPINRGSLQGLQRFKGLSWNLIIEGTVKLFGGIILVILGLGIYGAIISIVLSYIISFFVGFYPLRDIINTKKKEFQTREVYKFSIPILIALISLTLMYNIDVILVKHFFNEVESGYYMAVSKLGLILYFATLSISQVMFPKVSELYKKKKEHKHLLYKSLLINIIVIIPATIAFYLFPKLIINSLFGSKFLEAVPYVGPFAVIISLFSLIYIIVFYMLSINKKRFLYILLFFNVLQIVLITLFHASLMQIVNVLIVYMTLVFITIFSLTVFSSKNGKTINNNSSI